MGRTRKHKNKKHQQGNGLFGTAPVMQHPITQTVTKGGLVLLAAIAAGGAGAALGKHSLLAGIPVTLLGFHKKNPYIIAAGLGLTLSNGFQNQNKTTVQGVEGFDMKQIAEQAKDRVGTFFKNFSEKLYIKAEPTGTAGLAGEEQVTYFVNPYNAKELDMTAIDRIQEQIANMNGGMNAVDETEREF
ncbi:MAG: hypothetical protein IPK96_08695 [Flammeovirgaceae bacterium]|jgi:hypothetical protein|nr:hypothetical protein [Flammeovirgaceae bacterium]